MIAALARPWAALARWGTPPTSDVESAAVRAAARALDAVHATPAPMTRRQFLTELATLHREADARDRDAREAAARHRRRVTILTGEIAARDRQIADLEEHLAAALAATSSVRVPEQRTGAGS